MAGELDLQSYTATELLSDPLLPMLRLHVARALSGSRGGPDKARPTIHKIPAGPLRGARERSILAAQPWK